MCTLPWVMLYLQSIFTDMVRRFMTRATTMPTSLVKDLVDATLDLHKRLSSEMLPTPARPHYVFSIRHIALVFQVRAFAYT